MEGKGQPLGCSQFIGCEMERKSIDRQFLKKLIKGMILNWYIQKGQRCSFQAARKTVCFILRGKDTPPACKTAFVRVMALLVTPRMMKILVRQGGAGSSPCWVTPTPIVSWTLSTQGMHYTSF